MFSRTVDASLADIHVIRSREIPDSVFFRLIDLAVELTKQLEVGFMECVYAVSATCYNLINELVGRLQFKAVATLPNCVHMANGIGLCDSIVLIRNIEPLTYNRQVSDHLRIEYLSLEHSVHIGHTRTSHTIYMYNQCSRKRVQQLKKS